MYMHNLCYILHMYIYQGSDKHQHQQTVEQPVHVPSEINYFGVHGTCQIHHQYLWSLCNTIPLHYVLMLTGLKIKPMCTAWLSFLYNIYHMAPNFCETIFS